MSIISIKRDPLIVERIFAVHFMAEMKAPLVETHNAENANN